MKLQGIFVPIAVPFDHHGDLYPVKVQHNIEKLNRTGVSGYFVCGREHSYLSCNELLRVWEWVAQYAAPEKLLIAFTGRTSVRETVDLSNRVAKLGYKAAWAYDPNTVYVSSVADQIAIPLLLPWHAVPKVEHPNAFPQAVAVSSSNLAKAFADGATAAFSEFANAAPYAAISIWEAHRTREYEAALDWQNRIAQAVHLVEGQYGIAGLKYAMDLNGYYGGPPRLPLIGLTPAAKKEIEQAFDGLRG